MNRRAWLGHAGCCIAVDSPEDLTRLAWHTLTTEQQERADAVAEEAIATWERMHEQNLHLSAIRLSNKNQTWNKVLQET